MPVPGERTEHAARVRNPGLFVRIRPKPLKGVTGIRILGGPLKRPPKEGVGAGGKFVAQVYRFHRDNFTAAQAKAWIKRHNIKVIRFEAATLQR